MRVHVQDFDCERASIYNKPVITNIHPNIPLMHWLRPHASTEMSPPYQVCFSLQIELRKIPSYHHDLIHLEYFCCTMLKSPDAFSWNHTHERGIIISLTYVNLDLFLTVDVPAQKWTTMAGWEWLLNRKFRREQLKALQPKPKTWQTLRRPWSRPWGRNRNAETPDKVLETRGTS